MRKFGRLTSKPNCRLNSWLDRFLDRMSKPRTDGKVDSGCSRASLLRLREVAGLSLTEATHPPDLQVPPHSHEEAHFCLLLQGLYEENCGKHSLKLFRTGDTPVLRGTALVRNRRNATLWTRGWTPRLRTYPG